jgi:hypothetical protein
MLKAARRCILTAWFPDSGKRHTTAHHEHYGAAVNNPFTETPEQRLGPAPIPIPVAATIST